MLTYECCRWKARYYPFCPEHGGDPVKLVCTLSYADSLRNLHSGEIKLKQWNEPNEKGEEILKVAMICDDCAKIHWAHEYKMNDDLPYEPDDLEELNRNEALDYINEADDTGDEEEADAAEQEESNKMENE